MEIIKEFISNYNFEIILGMGIILFVLLIFNIVNQFRISSITKKYDRLVEGVEAGSLEKIIFQSLDRVDEVSEDIIKLKDFCYDLDDRLKLSVQKVGFIRYNAFSEMGNDLSFSIAMLDDKINGFVITSIYGRDECNTYAKSIINGKSKYNLSEEEIEAINRAINNKSFTEEIARS
ncbi:DUF4446 family protein [Sporosalibacterium faouarense]|uniref:DUF4446 family protein n=1 Tax=Sporosalibacterium faouarense TaxID=516123 RepID=UPI00141D1488|nr:DUF4446 family protein [Sporosalibacterium faouarense]MTI48634.1 DUF4446 family protein [Bacillota bacterium]